MLRNSADMDTRNLSRRISVDSEIGINVRGNGSRDTRTRSPTLRSFRSRSPTLPQDQQSNHTGMSVKSTNQVIKEKLLLPNAYTTQDVTKLIGTSMLETDLKTSVAVSRMFTDNCF